MNREPCSWEACLYKADDALLDVTLIHKGRSFSKARVPLCIEHLMVFRMTGRVTVRTEMLLTPEKR